MKKNIKLIIFDVDGTLINDDRKLISENIEVIKKLRDKGIKLVLNSGRTFNAMWRVRQALGLMDFDDYSICGTGAFIRRNSDGKALVSNPMGEKDYDKITSLLEGEDVQVAIHTKNYLYLNEEKPNRGFLVDQEQVGLAWMKFENFSDIEDGISRVSISAEPEVLDRIYDKYGKDLENDYKLMRNEVYILEVLNKNAGKSESLRKLLDILDMDSEEVMYFGDGMNDVKSLELAGVGVAIGSGKKEAKDAADFIIGNNNDPSIAKFLREYFSLDE